MEKIGENVTSDDVREIIDAGDTDKDGFLSFEEFVKMLSEKP